MSETKSDRFRRMLRAGKTVAEVATETRSNYAFVYGVAARAGLVETAAKRRPVRRVTGTADYTDVRTDVGTVRVEHSTGKTTRVRG